MAKEEKKADGDEKEPADPEQAAAKSKKLKLFIIIGAAVVLVLGIAGGLFFFMSGGSESSMAAKSGEDGQPAPDGEAKAPEDAEAEPKEEGAEPKEGGEEAQAKSDGDEKADDGIDFGCTETMKPFHMNLGNPLENHYIRLELSIEYGCAEELSAEIKKRLPQLRDAVIAVTTRKSREFLLGPDGKAQLRKEIHNRINHYMTRKIDNVFITDILIE